MQRGRLPSSGQLLRLPRPNSNKSSHAAEVRNLGVGRSTTKVAVCKKSRAVLVQRINKGRPGFGQTKKTRGERAREQSITQYHGRASRCHCFVGEIWYSRGLETPYMF